MSKNIFLKCMQ